MTDTATKPSGAPNDLRFNLIDDMGNPRTLDDFKGFYPLIFFGFTHCKVVCPRALARLSSVLAQLGPQSAWLAPLYISIDPERDTPQVMRAFLQASYPRFTGLTGDKDSIEKVRANYRVFAQRRPDPDDPAGYEMPHSALTYVIGPDGALLAHFADSVEEGKVVQRLRALLPRGAREI